MTMTVVALAGRRIDAADASVPRFPIAQVPLVKARLHDRFAAMKPDMLVCSAACGADLIALDAAMQLGIPCRVVLPFGESDFKATSVTDRPGDWGGEFDRLIGAVRTSGGLLVLDGRLGAETSYANATRRILDEAQRIAADHRAQTVAIVVWDGASRAADDATAAFGDEARRRGLEVVEILTQ